ncbi:hypothetical protein PaG_04274 [Moesziomyces aphidis]|uniref:Major facilitator superfamily (MFS) profile domain-containing protein n=1 Tax=Moesziomyces aphidis TaxID=84754 RepID=W3VL95_MOEAP|nr:hypothetical protein PaG_04274 [Moesziomyces aphidis]
MATSIPPSLKTISHTQTDASQAPPPAQDAHKSMAAASTPMLPLTPAEVEAITLEGSEDSRHWSHAKKWGTTLIISLMGFISPLGSSILVPGNGFVDHSFSLGSRTLSVLPVSLFVMGLGVGPFILAPCSETVGRQPVYVVTSAVFIAFNLASAFSPSFAALNVLRFFAGAAGSTGPSLGAGSIGDMFAPKERGRAQSLYGLGPLMGPVLGSILGCFIAAGTRNWRWLLHTLTILSGAVFVVIVLFLDETYAPVLLRKKRERAIAQRLQQIQDANHSSAVEAEVKKSRLAMAVQRWLPSRAILHKLKLAQSRPFRLLFTNPICAIFSYYLGFCYGIIYLFITQHPLLFQTRKDEPDAPSPQKLPTYNWTLGISGLSYLGLGLGFLVAAFTNALLQDEIYARLVEADGRVGWFIFYRRSAFERTLRHRRDTGDDVEQPKRLSDAGAEGANSAFGNVTPTVNPDKLPSSIPLAEVKKGRPEYRLPLCLVGMLILPVGLTTFGWSAANQTHWIVPLVGSFLVGCATILCFQTILVYLVDAFVPYSASATACAVLVRSVLAAAFPLCAEYMFEGLGYAWSCTLLAGIGLLGLPVPIILYRYGEHLRAKYKFKG